jgi:hypothetical protein
MGTANAAWSVSSFGDWLYKSMEISGERSTPMDVLVAGGSCCRGLPDIRVNGEKLQY